MYKRLTIRHSLLAGNTARLAYPKYHVPGNEEEEVSFTPDYAMIATMRERLLARGWTVERDSDGTLVLLKEYGTH